MSDRSGSEQRQRKHDVRIRLRDEDEVAQFDNLVRQKGYHGRTAKGDWLRSHLPGVSVIPAPPPRPITISPWENAIGAIDRLATEIEALHGLLDRMESGQLPFSDTERLKATLPEAIARLLEKASVLFNDMHEGLRSS